MFKLFWYFLSLFYWERQSREKIRAMQLSKFRKMFEYAREHSKFYHDVYEKAEVLDLEIKTWDDVEKVPIVTKEMMRAVSTEDIITSSLKNDNLNCHTTSGSSGTPFKIIYSKWCDYTGHIRFIFMLMKYRYTPFKRITLLSRYDLKTKFGIEKDLGIIKRIQKLFGIFERDIISIFETPSVIIQHLQENPPFALWTTPSAIFLVAKELEQRNERLRIPLLVLMSEFYTSDQIQNS